MSKKIVLTWRSGKSKKWEDCVVESFPEVVGKFKRTRYLNIKGLDSRVFMMVFENFAFAGLEGSAKLGSDLTWFGQGDFASIRAFDLSDDKIVSRTGIAVLDTLPEDVFSTNQLMSHLGIGKAKPLAELKNAPVFDKEDPESVINTTIRNYFLSKKKSLIKGLNDETKAFLGDDLPGHFQWQEDGPDLILTDGEVYGRLKPADLDRDKTLDSCLRRMYKASDYSEELRPLMTRFDIINPKDYKSKSEEILAQIFDSPSKTDSVVAERIEQSAGKIAEETGVPVEKIFKKSARLLNEDYEIHLRFKRDNTLNREILSCTVQDLHAK